MYSEKSPFIENPFTPPLLLPPVHRDAGVTLLARVNKDARPRVVQ
jgi:hypothetical protein